MGVFLVAWIRVSFFKEAFKEAMKSARLHNVSFCDYSLIDI